MQKAVKADASLVQKVDERQDPEGWHPQCIMIVFKVVE